MSESDCFTEELTKNSAEEFTIGVEEEYQIVDPHTRALRSHAGPLLKKAQAFVGDEVQSELYLSQIEIGTPICRTLEDVRIELKRLRGGLIKAGERDGSQIAAAGTHPFSHWDEQEITPKARYVGIWQDYQQLAREQLIFGCHVHVGISDRELAIGVMNRARIWLAPILALAANSPFWIGADTGYASFRTEIWRRWPMAGTPQIFESRRDYDQLIEALVATSSVTDSTSIYWDVRPSGRFETLEFRATDVCMTIDEAVMIAGLSRALAQTCYDEAQRGDWLNNARPELLRAAKWRAARYGLDADLVDVIGKQAVPAHVLVEQLLAYVRPALEANNEWTEVSEIVAEVLERGNGAARQRAAYMRKGSYEDVVDLIVSETTKGVA